MLEGNTKGAILVVTYERWHTTTYIGVSAHSYQTLRNILVIILFSAGCSNPTSLDGLWIERNGNALLRFKGDSVINNSLQLGWFRDTIGFRITKDSITWTGLNPDWNNGRPENTFRYELVGDQLHIWFKPDQEFVYFKSKAANYKDHFLTRGDLQINLPSAVNVKPTLKRYTPINIRIGFRDEDITIFVEETETDTIGLDKAIGGIVSKNNSGSVIPQEFICQLFMDENVPCGFTFIVFDRLRTNNIRTVNLVTETEQYDSFTSDFWGFIETVPSNTINLIEEKNER